MKALVISDIHGNYAALRAVLAEPHDLLLCLGDIVTYGPEPGACVREVRERAGMIVQGNHDRALGQGVSPRCRPPFRWLADATAPIGRAQVPAAERGYLGGLPRWAWATLDDVRLLAVHATPSDPLYGYLDPEPTLWQREVVGVDVDLLLVGHTHIQFEMTVGATRIVNPGSVGQPKDGDPRAAYAIIEQGQVSLRRAEYDVAGTVAALHASGTDPDAVAVLAELLRTGTMSSGRQQDERAQAHNGFHAPGLIGRLRGGSGMLRRQPVRMPDRWRPLVASWRSRSDPRQAATSPSATGIPASPIRRAWPNRRSPSCSATPGPFGKCC